jgi:hypothetical protein
MELVLKQGLPKGVLHCTFTGVGRLPAVEAHDADDLVDVRHDALDHDWGIIAEMYGCSSAYVHELRRRYGIPTVSRADGEPVDRRRSDEGGARTVARKRDSRPRGRSEASRSKRGRGTGAVRGAAGVVRSARAIAAHQYRTALLSVLAIHHALVVDLDDADSPIVVRQRIVTAARSLRVDDIVVCRRGPRIVAYRAKDANLRD